MTRPKILSFERKLDPSDAVLFSTSWPSRDNDSSWAALEVREKSVRGTISHDLKAGEQNPAKIDGDIKNANPQTVDIATLPPSHDTLVVRFTLRALGNLGEPTACGDPEYRKKLIKAVKSYVQAPGFGELAKRYAANLANGRFLWRNRIGAESVQVVVSHLKDGKPDAQWTFDAFDHDLHDLPASAAKVEALATLIDSGLSGSKHVLLQVVAFARFGAGQEVFPSQELILDQNQTRKVDGKSIKKSKTLYKVGASDAAVAAIHSQKIGNAIRTIDDWYEGADENGPIAVEPYGSVTTQGKAYRQPRPGQGQPPQDFYHLIDRWILRDEVLDLEQQHFVIATLIRGGVFGASDK